MNEPVKYFVQNVLGCGCPEKVFEYIDCQENVKINGITLKIRINIGNKLLVYILEVNNTEFLEGILADLISMGKQERDDKGFNRLRIVLAREKPVEIQDRAHAFFHELNTDEKIHLHIISLSDLSVSRIC